MVCNRCIMAVNTILEQQGLHPESVSLGEVTLAGKPDDAQLKALEKELNAIGFELIDDRRSRLIEKIKNVVIGFVHHGEEQPRIKYSEYLAEQLQQDYQYLSRLFSEVEGITIEQYIINQKIERVKELLAYGELTLNEIAWQMGYSSTAHLSGQFKKVTGLPPSHFRNIGLQHRKPLDEVGRKK